MQFDYPEIGSDSDGRNHAVRSKWRWVLGILVAAAILAFILLSRQPAKSEIPGQSLHEELKARRHASAIALIRIATDVNEPDEDGAIPLVLAANDRSPDAFDVVRELLKRGALPNVVGRNGYTALHWAAFHGNMAVADLLIRHGADVNAAIEAEWETPASMALINGKERVAEFLESFGASVPEEHRDGLRAAGRVKSKIDEMLDLPKPDSLTDEEWASQVADAAFESVHPNWAEDGPPLETMEAFRQVMEQPKPEGFTERQWQQNRMAAAYRLLLSGEVPLE